MTLLPTAAARCCLFVVLCFVTRSTTAQPLPDSTIRKIDRLFLDGRTAGQPCGAFCIVRNDALLYAKGYGLANMEYGLPNTANSIFNIASVSKQFAGYAVVLLVQQGKINLDADIRTYLPWFPDLKTKITVRNLLNHTSGIRDQWQLLAISGTKVEDVVTQEHIVKILSKQTSLNFPPGSRFLYSNSNYTLLAEIVKAVSGQTLRAFSDLALFRPLGMKDTHFHDDYQELVNNRSCSYDRLDSVHFNNAIMNASAVGASNLYTSVNDMSKWMINLCTPKVGNAATIQLLTQKGKLDDGTELDYASGIAIDTYDGWLRYSHNGSDAGFNSAMTVFPEVKTGIAVFGNVSDLRAMDIAAAIADLILTPGTQKPSTKLETPPKDSALAFIRDTAAVKKFIGDYIAESGQSRKIILKKNNLFVESNGVLNLLFREKNDTFAILKYPDVKYVCAKDPLTQTMSLERVFKANGEYTRFIHYNPQFQPSEKELQSYTGTYYCPELDCNYHITLKEHQIVLTHSKYDDAVLTLKGENHLFCDLWCMAHLLVIRDPQQKITGFEVNIDRVQGLRFTKMK